MRPVATSAPVSAAIECDAPAPTAAPPPRGIRKRAPDISIRLDFPSTFDPVVTERVHAWLVRQIAKRAVEILNAQEPKK